MAVSDTFKVYLRDVDVLNLDGEHLRRTADGKHLAGRTAVGPLSTYQVVKQRGPGPTMTDANGVMVPIGVPDRPGTDKPRDLYYALPDGLPFKPSYASLEPIVGHVPESRDALATYRQTRQQGFAVQALGMTAIVAGAALAVSGTTDESPGMGGLTLALGGAVANWIGFTMTRGEGHLARAVEAYNAAAAPPGE